MDQRIRSKAQGSAPLSMIAARSRVLTSRIQGAMLVLAVLVCVSVAAGAVPRVSSPDELVQQPGFTTVVHYGKRLGFAPLSEDTTHISPIALQVLPVRAVQVTWMGRAPVPEMVMVNSGDADWKPTLGDKELMAGWKRTMVRALFFPPAQLEGLGEDPQRIAEDITRLLVDPDPGLARVVSGPQDVPLDHPLSDVRQDLERSGRDASEIEKLLAQTIPPTIRPPAFEECTDRQLCLTFDSWDLHGGILCRWSVRLGQEPKIDRVVLAEGVGSYRRFYY